MWNQWLCSIKCQQAARYRRGAMCHTLSIPDAAYIAGLIDGEGAVMIVGRRNTIAVRTSVTNTNREILGWLSEVTGLGRVQAHRKDGERHRATWIWSANGDGVESLLNQIRPYMRIKHVQADLAIEAQTRLRDPAFKADRVWQMDYKDRMKAMNKRGPRLLADMTASSGG